MSSEEQSSSGSYETSTDYEENYSDSESSEEPMLKYQRLAIQLDYYEHAKLVSLDILGDDSITCLCAHFKFLVFLIFFQDFFIILLM